eukprot:gnl/MRDRNA2_/MRDRNA2_98341_c0_seq1.p1 gnl/MRDRNA2_/MRDRNA2_98341_c0~~gnl/MRDRNA2_/MRDRNA2_98341_c0_seq1.p1  ORF type:complete len:746 (+),score=191.45 gnl/MRDRNA2_/MRDRNA2_98341_c0_seq1:178-2415(+)
MQNCQISLFLVILFVVHGVSTASTCNSQRGSSCIADNADQGGSLLASHFGLDRLQLNDVSSDEHQLKGNMSRQHSWVQNHKKLEEAAEVQQDALTKFMETQKKSGDACSSRMLEAKRSLDGLLHDLKSLSTQVKDHMVVLEVEEQNLKATELSIDAVEDQYVDETAECTAQREKAIEELAGYTAELKELEQIADPSVRFKHVVTVEGMPELPEQTTPALLEEGTWSMKSCKAFVAYAKEHKHSKFISLVQGGGNTNATVQGSKAHQKPRHFQDLGAGCCSGKANQSRSELMTQVTFKGFRDDLKACKKECKNEGPQKCGFIEYGWIKKDGSGQTTQWCVVHPPGTECSTTKAGPKDCGGGGGDNGVHAYKFLQTPAEPGKDGSDQEPEIEENPEPYNCLTREEWSGEKKKWCCKNKGLGCKLKPKPAPMKPIILPEPEKHVDDFGEIDEADAGDVIEEDGTEGGDSASATTGGSGEDDDIEDESIDAEKPASPIQLNCNQQRKKLQRIFTKAYNAVKDLKQDAKERVEDKTCQETADAKRASLLVPLVSQREQATGRIEYSDQALAALKPVLQQVETRAGMLQDYIRIHLIPECEEATEVSKYLQDVRDLIISLQSCPGRDDFTLKIPTDKDPESRYFQKCFDTSYGKICGTRMRTGGKGGNGHYMMTPKMARSACKDLNSKLCTLEEVELAYKQNIGWCSWGFVTDDKLYSIMQEDRQGCPPEGLNGPKLFGSGKGNAWCCSKF